MAKKVSTDGKKKTTRKPRAPKPVPANETTKKTQESFSPPETAKPRTTRSAPALVQKGKLRQFKSDEKLEAIRKSLEGKMSSQDYEVPLDSSSVTKPIDHIPTGSIVLDHLISGPPNQCGVYVCPGWPRSKLIQIGGLEGTGKSTITLHTGAQICDRGGSMVFIDWEHSFSMPYAMSLGISDDPRRFMWAQPDTLEDGFRLAYCAALTGVELIVFDSAGAGVPEKYFGLSEAEIAEMGEVGLLQRKWAGFLPKITKILTKTGTSAIGISQFRSKMNMGKKGGGPSYSWEGGNAWKYYSSLRLELKRIGGLHHTRPNPLTGSSERVEYAAQIQAKCVKSKVSSVGKRAQVFYLRHGEGVDSILTAMEVGIRHGVISKSGNHFTWETPSGQTLTRNGKENFREAIRKNPGLWRELYQAVHPHLYAAPDVDPETEMDGDEDEDILDLSEL